MLFQSNMNILQESYPETWKKILQTEEKLDKSLVQVVTNKNNIKTLKLGEYYIHEEKNPILEATNFIKQFKNINEHSDILFYGIGLGYQINAYLQLYPNTPFSIYEPIPEVFYEFLHHFDLKQLPPHLIENIYIETDEHDIEIMCAGIIRKIRNSILVINLPSYQQIFPQKHQAFFKQFEYQLNERRISIATTSAFEKRWTINSVKNLIHVLKSPNVLLENKAAYKNKPALLVASGPSLEEDIDNLRIISENGLAYIFSVGTALNTLVRNGIHPYAACTYDPTEENQIIGKEVIERGIKSIPLIYGSTVGYETLEKYPGPQAHAIIGQDRLAVYYLKPRDGKTLEVINDAATVAVISLQLMYKLGFNPIILVGQNLAFRNGKRYAAGSTYHHIEVSQPELDNAVMVEDVYDNDVHSTVTFIRMRKQLEHYISQYKDITVINTTKGGAHIEGTIFSTLDEVVLNYLNEKIVNDDWNLSPICSYDTNYLAEQHNKMQKAYQQAHQLLNKCQLNLDHIGKVKESNDAFIINQSYEQFNQSMSELRNNLFITTFIEPMNRMELEFLMLAVPKISALRDPIPKAQAMEKEFRTYLLNCEQEIKTISPLYNEMKTAMEHFCLISNIRLKAAQTKLLLIDCDGVLTDGMIYYTTSGDQVRGFNYKDLQAVKILQEMNIKTILLCSEEDHIIRQAAHVFGIQAVYSGDKNEVISIIRNDYGNEYIEMACIFNGFNNVEASSKIGLSFAVQNSVYSHKNEVDYVLTSAGGQGAVMEMVELFFK